MDYLRSGPATQALRDSGFSEAAAR
jgi:hypothetical protein